MQSIQCLGPQDSPLAALAQQGVEAMVQIAVAEPSMGNRRGEPSVGNWFADQTKSACSEEASSTSGGKGLADAGSVNVVVIPLTYTTSSTSRGIIGRERVSVKASVL
jgi:hypothetical protein